MVSREDFNFSVRLPFDFIVKKIQGKLNLRFLLKRRRAIVFFALETAQRVLKFSRCL